MHGCSEDQIALYLSMKEREGRAGKYAEGDKVKLDIQRLTANPHWPKLIKKYREWVLSHADQTFTVQYDPKHTKNPTMVCLAEDDSVPKWLFFVGDLKAV